MADPADPSSRTPGVLAPASTPRRERGFRPSRLSEAERTFRTPPLPTPVIARQARWPATDAGRDQVIDAVDALELETVRQRIKERRFAVGLLLDWLGGFEGENWQQRWDHSGANDDPRSWPLLVPVSGNNPSYRITQFSGAALRLILVDAIRPSYRWLFQAYGVNLYTRFEQIRDPDGFAALDEVCAQMIPRFTEAHRRSAYVQLSRMLIHNGGRLADITLEDCIEVSRAQLEFSNKNHTHWYPLLRQAGILPATTPPTILAASRRGQLTITELVDQYELVCVPVRDLFVDYLHERAPGLDYSSLRQLVTKLIQLFWKDLELHEPGIDSLHLSDEVARRWKQRLGRVRHGHRVGARREDPQAILMAVRALYADLAHWALEDPARWAQWAVPSPVTSRDLAGIMKQRQRSTARMHQRIRELAPTLPLLVAAAEEQRTHGIALLAAATAAQPGELFSNGGLTLRRCLPSRSGAQPGVIFATAPDGTGSRINITLREDYAFWTWAIIEVLRHTGMRIEEALELTHRSFIAYTLPSTGEVVPLLQVAPSKTDRERLLMVSPELAEALSAIITRVRGEHDHLPLMSRYDGAERLHSQPLPFLFQRPSGPRQQAVSHMFVKQMLDRLVTISPIPAADGRALRFTPHDFRRIFATDAVAAGLPVHIAAKILGHLTLAATQTYVAVYDHDVIEHHRAFIARRRSLRPSEEYREPTDAEWDEFLGHFEKRKVELGICGRAYGTPCQHEHACIRCPMLRPDPAQLHRLEEIITNLHDRLAEARERGWLGEVDGLEASLVGAEQRPAAVHRAAAKAADHAAGPVPMGIPTLGPPDTPAPRPPAVS